MTVSILGKSKEKTEKLISLLKKYNIDYCEEDPDFVISYGGDGMFLIAERQYPFVPKVLIRDSKVCNNCPNLTPEEILERLSNGEYEIFELPKIRGTKESKGEVRELIGVNDIVLRNFLPTAAIRFQYKVHDGGYSSELIGDGMVVATPFGSNKGAYFHSITRNSVKDKIGIAFNNTTTHHPNTTMDFGQKLEITINRGEAVLVTDNNHDYVPLAPGDKIIIEIHHSKARIVSFDDDKLSVQSSM